MKRRTFLRGSATAAGLALANFTAQRPRAEAKSLANSRIAVAMAGVRGRGNGVLRTFAAQSDVDVVYVCDVDAGVLNRRTEEVTSQSGREPESIKDFRRALDDKSVDALALGTPDHWHAIPTIMACQAQKDVYVEKPDGHNIVEGQTMVAAARKHGRIVQLGTQARSSRYMLDAIQYIRQGHLGRVRMAKAWESARQGSLGHPPDSEPPAGVDYDMWLGPAPQRPFNRLRFHGSWRWFFDYGTGDLGNDGVHRLDYARWGLETALAAEGRELAALPQKVSALGGKHYFDDAQEWPDTLVVSYDYGHCVLTYDLRIWTRYPFLGESEGAAIYGDKGFVILANGRWRAFDDRQKLLAEGEGTSDTDAHVRNFLDCMRSREKPTADLETVGHPSSLLCHMGNAAWRTGRTLQLDAATYTFAGDQEANQYLSRPEYRKPWTLPSINAV